MTEKQAIAFSKLFPPEELEKDRYPLPEDLNITITAIYISTRTRYGEVAKITGIVDGEQAKYYTFAGVIIKYCKEILSRLGPGPELKQPVDAHIFSRQSADFATYWDMK